MRNRRKKSSAVGRARWAGGVCVVMLTLLAVQSGGTRTQQAALPDTLGLNHGRLIPSSTSMVTAWSIPRDPSADSTLGDSLRAARIRWGFRLFMNTTDQAPQFTKNRVQCNNCHLNGGQRELAMPLVGVASVFPEYNNREGRMITLEDRIVGCFQRSENATGAELPDGGKSRTLTSERRTPDPESREVVALAAYITWLSEGFAHGDTLRWRGHNIIPADRRIPVAQLSRARGKTLFLDKCAACHGRDGQGVQIGDKKAGPLWGPASWNDGAGAARVYTLAGMIRYTMPYLNPGSLTDEEAQQIAAFINSMPRPEFPHKDDDYRTERLPPDAVYYKSRP